MLRLIFVLLFLLSVREALAQDGGRWACRSDSRPQAYWFDVEPGNTVIVYELKRECGSSRLARDVCLLSAGNLIATAQSINSHIAYEVDRYEWGNHIFSIFYDDTRSREYFGREVGDPSPFRCEFVSRMAQTADGPHCGCNGSDRGTEICRGHGPMTCH